MFQRKVITMLILIIVIQAFALAYFKQDSLKSAYHATFSRENIKGIWKDIRNHISPAKTLPLSSIEKLPLRKFKITVDPAQWRKINSNLSDTSPRNQIPAKLVVNGDTYECTARISKGGLRHWKGRRKSIRLRFPTEKLFNRIREINLNIPETKMVIEDAVAWEFAKRMGLVTPEFEFVNVEINGQDQGIHLFYEDVDVYFLERHGLMGYIFTEKDGWFPFDYRTAKDSDYPEVNVINKKGNTLDELRWLDKVLSYPSIDQFGEQIVKLADLEEVLTWHANALICGSGHQNVHNIKLFFNSALQKFQFIPWDIAGFDHWGHDPLVTWAMDLDWSTNRFIFQVNQIPELTEERNRILWEVLHGPLSLENQMQIVDRYYKLIRYHIYVDELKQASEYPFSNQDFEEAIQKLKKWIESRYNFIIAEIKKSDMRVSANPMVSALLTESARAFGNNFKIRDGMIISLGTGKQTGIVLKSLKVPIAQKDINVKKFRLFLDTNGNNFVDPGDREIKILTAEPYWQADEQGIKLTVDELLLPARIIQDDPYFDYVDKGYKLQTRPLYRYYNFMLTCISGDHPANGAEYFANSVQVGTINAITDEAVKPEYFTSDQEKIYALSYEERNAGNGQGFNLLSAIERNSADKNDHTIDLTAYLKTLKSKQNVVIPGGNYVLNETWRVNPEEVFSIAAGTQIIINSGISIYVSGVLNFEGKPELPVILKNSVEGEPWGCLAYHKTQMNSHLNNVIIRFAGMAKIDSVNFTGGVSAYDATIFLNSCTFENIRADDGINVKNSETRLVNCRFVQAKDDAIDFDFSNGEIRDCYFYKSGGDAIDCGTASPKIIGNLFEYPGDKCISLGEASSPVIENNLLFGGSYGIAIKDNSNPVIKNNTICANDKGIALYIKKPKEFGCPTATIERCIIWDNKVEIENLCEAKFIIKNSAVKGGYSGEKIYSTPPEFSSGSGSLTSRYVLKENSTYALKGLGATKGSWQ